MVGSGHHIPIQGFGHTLTPPPHPHSSLKNVLYAPNIIKNLIYVRKFATDNSVSINFDPFGFSVTDLRTGKLLTRCNSEGDLYLFLPTSDVSVTFPTVLTTISPSMWHSRLGHPGSHIFYSLKIEI
ncbi:hypothetical protein RND71_009962 [Anisodus tanguticus]|uniref:GAG-pre-integrase domain-containing protein n=1 Tax=Anisodus tanguticus TaxID=243964 RepID=A0AAE1SJD8_9SOLA|nr:hypothetical protein RND71_009962 [Anisodus tanguticus]